MASCKKGLRLGNSLVFLFTAAIGISAVLSLSDTAFAELDCQKCHKLIADKKVVHPALQMGCETCHTEPHKKDAKFPKGLSAEPPELCFGCHDKAMFSKTNVHPPVAMGMCLSCHNPHSTDNPKLLIAEPPDLCFTCHDKKVIAEGKVVHPPVMGGMCLSCHNPHSSENEKVLQSPRPDLCFTCHDKTKFESKMVHPPVAAGMCNFCHFPHQGENERLLVFPQPDLCFNCHDKAEFTRQNIHAAVLMGCTTCHNPHANKQRFLFEKSVYNVCTTCHVDVPNSPHAIAGFLSGTPGVGHPLKARRIKNKEGKADFQKDPLRPDRDFACSSCHNPHSSDSIRLFRYKAAVPFEICNYCHKK